MSYTKVVDAEVKQYGVAIAYTLEKMRSLCINKADDEGYCFFTDKLAIETFGVVQHKTQWVRLIKEMKDYGLIIVKKKATAIGRVNFYKLTDLANSEPTRSKFIRTTTTRTNTFNDPKKAEKAVKRQQIIAAQTTYQNTPDMAAPTSPEPIVDAPSTQGDMLTMAYRRMVVPAGIHKVMENGGEMTICSDGTNPPLVAQSRFKMQIMEWCVENGVEYPK